MVHKVGLCQGCYVHGQGLREMICPFVAGLLRINYKIITKYSLGI